MQQLAARKDKEISYSVLEPKIYEPPDLIVNKSQSTISKNALSQMMKDSKNNEEVAQVAMR